MNARKAYISYFTARPIKEEKTWDNYHIKASAFTEMYKNYEIEDVLNKEVLKNFILSDNTPPMAYAALKKFYEYVHDNILMTPEDIKQPFPIDTKDVPRKDKTQYEPDYIFLDKGFNFNLLFNDNMYDHLGDKNCILTMKATMAICLTCAFSTREIETLTCSDIKLEDNSVKVKNLLQVTSDSKEEWFVINGDLAKYIIEYHNIRTAFNTDSEIYFERMWNGRDFIFNKEIGQMAKPSIVKSTFSYTLKYISKMLNISPNLAIKHLCYNTILHRMYLSNGRDLELILRTYGWVGFVRVACDKYFNETDSSLIICAFEIDKRPDMDQEVNNHFFHKSSSSSSKIQLLNSLFDEDYLYERINALKRKRNVVKVKELKQKYSNQCQICGEAIILLRENDVVVSYSEVAHIQPHSEKGMDDFPNMLVLCPNHHILMDLGIISFDLNDKDLSTLIHIDNTHQLHKFKLNLVKHILSLESVKYHYENVHLPLLKKLQYT